MIASVADLIASPETMGIITVLGLAIGAYGIQQQRKARREVRTVTWDDVRIAVDELVRKIRATKGSRWRPDFLFSFSARGGIAGEMLGRTLCPGVPHLIGITVHGSERKEDRDLEGFHSIQTLKWTIYVPEQVRLFDGKRILLIDDYVQAGTGIRSLKALFKEIGIKPRELVTCAVVKSAAATSFRDQVPDFYGLEREDHRFFWPWGIAR